MLVGLIGLHHVDDFAAVNDNYAIRKVEYLVQLQGDKKHRLAPVALLHQPLVDVLYGPDIEPPGGAVLQ